MRAEKIRDGYIVRLFKGEKIIKILLEFLGHEDIRFGYLTGLGGASIKVDSLNLV